MLEEGRRKKDTRKIPLGFRRISFDEIEWINTKGRSKEFPRLVAGYITWVVGLGAAMLPAAPLLDLDGSFPIWLVPVGVSVAYLSLKIVEPILRRNYNMDEWLVEIISK